MRDKQSMLNEVASGDMRIIAEAIIDMRDKMGAIEGILEGM